MLAASILVDVEEPAWLTTLGLLSIALAVLFAVPPFYYLKRLGKPPQGAAYYATSQVVDTGLYEVVRHPQYLGYVFLVWGFAFLDPHWLSVAMAACACAAFYVQTVLEERFCSQRFGVEYVDYLKKVPRFNFVQGLLRIVYRRLK